MTTFTRCPVCRASDAPWSTGHRRRCPEYVSREPVQTCAVCSSPARVVDVEPLAAVVTWGCDRCGLTWRDDVRLLDDDPAPDDDLDDMEL